MVFLERVHLFAEMFFRIAKGDPQLVGFRSLIFQL